MKNGSALLSFDRGQVGHCWNQRKLTLSFQK